MLNHSRLGLKSQSRLYAATIVKSRHGCSVLAGFRHQHADERVKWRWQSKQVPFNGEKCQASAGHDNSRMVVLLKV